MIKKIQIQKIIAYQKTVLNVFFSDVQIPIRYDMKKYKICSYRLSTEKIQ